MKEVELEKIFKALANGRRLAILKYIKKSCTATVGEVARGIKLSFKATSKHLLILSNVGILDKQQVSLAMIYTISKHQHPIVSKLIHML